mmetsp:Transcript_48380/g.138943  ORF Transcript_48380/g.138943 Transcript_48380/m.138943 type:complete len:268 (+) Transcript_48380:82-885(+)
MELARPVGRFSRQRSSREACCGSSSVEPSKSSDEPSSSLLSSEEAIVLRSTGRVLQALLSALGPRAIISWANQGPIRGIRATPPMWSAVKAKMIDMPTMLLIENIHIRCVIGVQPNLKRSEKIRCGGHTKIRITRINTFLQKIRRSIELLKKTIQRMMVNAKHAQAVITCTSRQMWFCGLGMQVPLMSSINAMLSPLFASSTQTPSSTACRKLLDDMPARIKVRIVSSTFATLRLRSSSDAASPLISAQMFAQSVELEHAASLIEPE